MNNPYETLGLKPGATDDEIKAAYRRMARKYHPDLSTEPDANERMLEVNEAWKLIGDPIKKLTYDRTGRTDLDDDGKVEEEAKNILRQMFSKAFDNMHVDPPSFAASEATNSIQQLQVANHQVQQAIDRYVKYHKRLESKSNGKASFIHYMMELKLTEFRQGMERNKHMIRVMEHVISLSQDFCLLPDEEQAHFVIQWNIAGGTGWTGPGTAP